MDIITGEKFQYLCDVYIGEKEFETTSWIYNNTLYKDKCVLLSELDNNEKFLKANYIFVYTHILRRRNLGILIDSLNKKKNIFTLIFHNSDDNVDSKFKVLLSKTKCKKIFAQNVCINNSRIINIPIGIANSKWKHGNKELLTQVINKKIIKEDNTFFNFNINTNSTYRNECFYSLKNKLFFSKFDSQEKYLNELKKCKFCISPIGNGVDCHRIWECLYLKTIPICLRSIHTEILSQDFPIFIIDSWKELIFDDNFYRKYDNYIKKLDFNKLKLSYWKNLIINVE